jgi:hypothetical protein
MFCPKCRTEYRPGFTMCADCGLTLVAELLPSPPKEPETPLSLITIFESSNLPELVIARSILEEAGVEHILNAYSDGAFLGHAKMLIKVSNRDAGKARDLLAQIEQGNPIQEDGGFDEGGDIADGDQP